MVAAKSLKEQGVRSSQIGPKRCTGSLMMVDVLTIENYYQRARSRLGPGGGGGGPQ